MGQLRFGQYPRQHPRAKRLATVEIVYTVSSGCNLGILDSCDFTFINIHECPQLTRTNEEGYFAVTLCPP